MAWTLDQASVVLNASNSGNNPTTFSTSAAVASGGHLFLEIFSDLLPTGITAGGNAMTKDKSDTFGGSFSSLWSIYLAGGLASSSTISIAFSGNPTLVMILGSSFTGGATSSYLDQVNSRTASGSGTSWTSSSITPTVANTLVIGTFVSAATTDARSTPDAGWTEAQDAGGFTNNLVVQYRVVTDTSAYNPSGVFAASQTGADQIGLTANYKQAGGGTSRTVTAVVASSTASAVAPPKPRPTAPFAEINVRM